MRATIEKLILVVGIVLVNFVYTPVITNTNWLPCSVFGRGPNMCIPSYSNGPLRKTALAAVGIFGAYGSVHRKRSRAQLCRPHRTYEACIIRFSWSGTFDVCQGGRLKGNNNKGIESWGIGRRTGFAEMPRLKRRVETALGRY